MPPRGPVTTDVHRPHFEMKVDAGKSVMVCKHCGKSYQSKSYHNSNAANHMAHKHQDLLDAETKRRSASTLENHGFTSTDKERIADQWRTFFCRYSLAFRAASDPSFRELIHSGQLPPPRKALSEGLVAAAGRTLARANSFFSRPTLCIDVGTVSRRRFIVFALVEHGYSCVTRCIRDDDMGGRMTISAIKTQVKLYMKELRGVGIHVLTVTADNASNMQGLKSSDSDDEAVVEEDVAPPEEVQTAEDRAVLAALREESIAFMVRCAAHCVQLAVNGFKEEWMPMSDAAEEVRKNNPTSKIPPPNHTRWSSHYRLLEVVKRKGLGGQVDGIQLAIDLLAPFDLATRTVQSDWATLLHSAGAWTLLHNTVSEQLRSVPVAGGAFNHMRRVAFQKALTCTETRMEFQITELYCLLAYFSNTTESDPAFEDIIGTMIQRFDTDAFIEWELFLNLPIAPRDTVTVTPENYMARVGVLLKDFPVLRELVRAVSGACATEASVERGFSSLRRGMGYLRGKLTNKNCESQLILASFKEPPKTVGKSSPQPACRGEVAAAEIEDDVLQAVQDTIKVNKIALNWFFERVRVIAVLKYQARQVGAAAEEDELDDVDLGGVAGRTRHAGRRREVLMCMCGLEMATHEVKLFVVCACKQKRASLKCAGYRLQRLDKNVLEKNELRQYPGDIAAWVCAECARKKATE